MPISNGWIIRELVVRLRQPGMQPQRRFMVAVSLLMVLFVIGAVIYLFRQPTDDAMEQAAIKVFAVMGILIAIVIAAAVVVRKRTGVRWSQDEALRMAGERREAQQQPKSHL
jgi:flagellar biogenesis protein FliO